MNARAARLARAIGLATVAVAAAAVPLSVDASIGTGVGATPISLTETAQPGNTYTLPSLYLVNTGTEQGQYAVRIARLEQGQQLDVPSSWVTVPSSTVHLAASGSTYVELTLKVPAGAALGDYMTDVVAGTVATGGATGGASLGAQAATQLRFTVGSGGSGWSPPAWAGLGLLAVAVIGGLVRAVRRSGLRLHLERRR